MRMLLLAILFSAAPLAAQAAAQGAPAIPAAAPPVAPAQAPTPATVMPEGTRPIANEYILNAGDVIHVDVVDEPLLTKSYRIETDGTFDYTYLGRIMARGKTPRQVEDELRRGLVDGGFVLRPQLNVEIETPRARFIAVVGEVRQPGRYPLGVQMRVLDAITQAGYLLPSAGARALIVRQPSGMATAEQGAAAGTAPATIEVNLNDLQLGKFEQNIELKENDTLTVLKAEKFYVTGQVKNTGAQTWEPGLTVREALIMAGGIAEKGSARRIRIIRQIDAVDKQGKPIRDKNGNVTKVEQKIDVDQTTIVQPEDVIEVQQRLL